MVMPERILKPATAAGEVAGRVLSRACAELIGETGKSAGVRPAGRGTLME